MYCMSLAGCMCVCLCCHCACSFSLTANEPSLTAAADDDDDDVDDVDVLYLTEDAPSFDGGSIFHFLWLYHSSTDFVF